MKTVLPRLLRSVWSSTRFHSPELTRFARAKTVEEARKGLMAMSILTIVILVIEAVLYVRFMLEPMYLYTCAILVLLSLTMVLAARRVAEPRALHLLGVTLLVFCASAFVLLAHYQQVFHPMLFASIAMLFIVIPMMSWGLGEALLVTLLIYGLFTLSTLNASFSMDEQSLWTLQFIMLGAGAVSLSLVIRNVKLRKHDVEIQHDLVVAHQRISNLSNCDPLTGAWNRRFFDEEFARMLKSCRSRGNCLQFMLIDVDDFKALNDECGHEVGDRVLVHIAEAFAAVLPEGGKVVRMGGDEFALIFEDPDPVLVAAQGLKKLTELTAENRHPLAVATSLSFGVATLYPEVEAGSRQLYKVADRALYDAKCRKSEDPTSPNIAVNDLRDADHFGFNTLNPWRMPAAGGGSGGA